MLLLALWMETSFHVKGEYYELFYQVCMILRFGF